MKGRTYTLNEIRCGYKVWTKVRVHDATGDLKTCIVLNKKGESTGEFIYAKENQLEEVK
jgi:hypothetical protein